MTEIERREFLRRSLLAGGVVIGGGSFLLACGGDDTEAADTDDATPSAEADTGTAESSDDSTAAEEGSADGGEEAANELYQMLGITAEEALVGLTLPIGAVIPLSGGGEQSYGKSMVEAIDLAVQQISNGGGPAIELTTKDNVTGAPEPSVTAINELGNAGVGAALTSLVNSFAAMNEGVEQFEILSLDGGGGTATWNKGVPYFYGTRAVSPDDTLNGMAQYLQETFPDKKTWAAVTWALAPELNELDKNNIVTKLTDAGLEFSGTYELVAFGEQDYSAAIAKLKEANADYVLVGVYGPDPGVFASQSKAAGLESMLVGFEYTEEGASAARGAWDDGWLFIQDFFDAERAESPLGAHFARTYQEAYGRTPDFYAANYYENVFVLYELARRVNASGGDITSGADMLAALEENPTVISVYGGDSAANGSYTLDLESHSVKDRRIGVFEYASGSITPKAFFNVGGTDYRTV